MGAAASGDSPRHATGQKAGLIGKTLSILQVAVPETATRTGSAGRTAQPLEDG